MNLVHELVHGSVAMTDPVRNQARKADASIIGHVAVPIILRSPEFPSLYLHHHCSVLMHRSWFTLHLPICDLCPLSVLFQHLVDCYCLCLLYSILELNTHFCSAVLLKVSPDIEMLQLLPSQLYIFWPWTSAPSANCSRSPRSSTLHHQQTAQGVPGAQQGPSYEDVVMYIKVFTLPHVFRTILMRNATESDGVRANFCRVRVSLHRLAGANLAGTPMYRAQTLCGLGLD